MANHDFCCKIAEKMTLYGEQLNESLETSNFFFYGTYTCKNFSFNKSRQQFGIKSFLGQREHTGTGDPLEDKISIYQTSEN